MRPSRLAHLLAAVALLGCAGEDPAPEDTGSGFEPDRPEDTDAPVDLDAQLQGVLAGLDVPVGPLEPLPAGDPARVEVGRLLFWDPVLSGNRDVACATCHHPDFDTSDGLPRSLGTGATGTGPERGDGDHREPLLRRAPMLWNRARLDVLFWDGRVALEDGVVVGGVPRPPGGDDLDLLAVQALHPLLDPVEMLGVPGDVAVDGGPNELADGSADQVYARLRARLAAIPDYDRRLSEAFPEVGADWTLAEVARALAVYQRHAFDPTDTAWDRYLRGDTDALTDDQKLGATFFFAEGRCGACHSGPLLSDERFHNLGIPFVGVVDRGREDVTGDPADAFAFRTPPLRNVTGDGPYFHNGAAADLSELFIHYADPAAGAARTEAAHLPDDLDLVGTDAEREGLAGSLSEDLPTPGNGASTVGLSNLRAFLRALEDPAARDRAATIPRSVPSGLPPGGGRAPE